MQPRLALEDTPHGLQVHYNGRALYGPYPREDAARRTRSLRFPPNTLILWASPVVWHGLDELLKQIDADSAILAVEADPVLYELARRKRPDLVQHRLALVPTQDSQALAAVRTWGERRFRRVVQLTTAGSAVMNRERYRTLASLLERELHVFWQNRLTLSALGRLWLRNAIRNLPALLSARALERISGPVVVCGAGPSLETALPLLRNHRSACTLIAVDTALPVLHAAGLAPDVVLAIEGQLANVYDFLPVTERPYRLVADVTSAPAVLDLHSAWTLCITRFAPLALIDRLGRLSVAYRPLPPLGSVGVSAVHLAMELGASPVLTAGLDFAVLPGRTHARGAPAYTRALARSHRLQRARDAGFGARIVTLQGARNQVGSTLVMNGYAAELRSLLAPRDDAYAIAPCGLDTGATPVSHDRAAQILACSGRPAVQEAAAATVSLGMLRRFVIDEIDALRRFDPVHDSIVCVPDELDYLGLEITDRIESIGDRIRIGPLDEPARARLRVARDYYLSRWSATLHNLER
ncbi:MAG: 6-hydroxymethylpterin diphosphokinase MptE-like protein [Spirochaetota bacterium]